MVIGAPRRRPLRLLSLLMGAFLALTMGASTLAAPGMSVAGATSGWSSDFSGFAGSSWAGNWGLTSNTEQCQGATSTFGCNWGFAGAQTKGTNNVTTINDPTTPGGGTAIQVTYPAQSGPPSCSCALGGAQFYQWLGSNTAVDSNGVIIAPQYALNRTDLTSSPTIDLKYWYKFPTNFDFGGRAAGKMPGLYGGTPGCESGGQHCNGGWSTRYMWRGLTSGGAKGEVYFYSAAGSGYGADLCLGNWTFRADGQWHSIEQMVNVQAGTIDVYSDNVYTGCHVSHALGTTLGGVFFSTFHGGHDTSWSPTTTTHSEFADFSLSTALQNGTTGTTTTTAPTTTTTSPTTTTTGATTTTTAPTTTTTSPSGPLVSNLTVFDSANAANWSVQQNLQVGNTAFGDRTYTWTTVPSALAGDTWVRTAAASKTATENPLVSFTVNQPSTVYVGVDTRLGRRSWMGSNWADTGTHLQDNDADNATFEVFAASYPAGTVSLGPNVGSGSTYLMYTVIVAPSGTTGTTTTTAPTTTTTPPTTTTTGATTTTTAPTTTTTAPTTTTTTISGSCPFIQSDIDNGVAAPLIAFGKPTSSVPRPGTNPIAVGEANTLYFLALANYVCPGAAATNGTTVQSALLAQVRNLVAGGNEPDADGGLEGWSHNGVAQALLMLKNAPATWAMLSSSDQNKVSLLEAAMGFGGNYTYNDANNFSSGICGFGNFSKSFNPNYRDGYVDVEIAVIQYFGGISNWDNMLASFNDATEASQLNAAGLTNAGGCFQTVGSAANSAIQQPWLYMGSNDYLTNYGTISAASWRVTATYAGPSNCNGAGAVQTNDPVQGQNYMDDEFNTTDSSGCRSSALYAYEEAMNLVTSRASIVALGHYGAGPGNTSTIMNVGMHDLIWKLEVGYYSQALGQSHLLVTETQPASDGPSSKGYFYIKDIWNTYVGHTNY